ncbi:RNA polymerase sigma factor [Pacificimonas flava]|uniref:Sigma factor, ECF subfamily n=1 Tax=Pacificimonas flava TaxID=1234595 RepID=M2TMA3_9SPHN|nr:RNA polymerase sigma factor [Pacificimonas flava]EMD82851.1 Sigma factor, ECF subfamily [Pacificimonas flava]MBB5279466.1 RNA polymerase sigma-70 factor (ECF subfamily) [Pacificimonas flava]
MDSVADIYELHHEELFTFLLRRLRDRGAAADLVQELFVRLAERGGAPGVANRRAYLYRMAANLATDRERQLARRGRFEPVEAAHFGLCDDTPNAEDALLARERLRCVQRAIAAQPPLTQEIVRMVRLEGKSYRRAADILGISESSVQKHLARAVKAAAAALRYGEDSITGPNAPNVLPLRKEN